MSNRIKQVGKEPKVSAYYEFLETIIPNFLEKSVSGKGGHQIYGERLFV